GRQYKVNPVKANGEIMTLDELKRSVIDAPAVQNVIEAARERYDDVKMVVNASGNAELEVTKNNPESGIPTQARLPLYIQNSNGEVSLLGLSGQAAQSLNANPNEEAVKKLETVFTSAANVGNLYNYAIGLGYKITRNADGTWTFSHANYPGITAVTNPVKKDGANTIGIDALESILKAEAYKQTAIRNGYTVISTDSDGVALTDADGYAVWEITTPRAMGAINFIAYPFSEDLGFFSLDANSLEMAAAFEKLKLDAEKDGYTVNASNMSKQKGGYWLVSKDGITAKVFPIYMYNGRLTRIEGSKDLENAISAERLRLNAVRNGYAIRTIDASNIEELSEELGKDLRNSLGNWVVTKQLGAKTITFEMSPILMTSEGRQTMTLAELGRAVEMEALMQQAIAAGYGVVERTDAAFNKYWEVEGSYGGNVTTVEEFYPVDAKTGAVRTFSDMLEAVRVQGLFDDIVRNKDSLQIAGKTADNFNIQQELDEKGNGIWRVQVGNYKFTLYPFESKNKDGNITDRGIRTIKQFQLYAEHSINVEIAKQNGANGALQEIVPNSNLGKLQQKMNAKLAEAFGQGTVQTPLERQDKTSVSKQTQSRYFLLAWLSNIWTNIKTFFGFSTQEGDAIAETFNEELETDEISSQELITSLGTTYNEADLPKIWDALKTVQETSYVFSKEDSSIIVEKIVRSVDGIRINEKGELIIVYNEEHLAPVNPGATRIKEGKNQNEYNSVYTQSFAEHNGRLIRQNIPARELEGFGIFAQSLYFVDENARTVDGRTVYFDFYRSVDDIELNPNVTSVVGKVGSKEMMDYQFKTSSGRVLHLSHVYGTYYEGKAEERVNKIKEFTSENAQGKTFTISPQRVFLGGRMRVEDRDGKEVEFATTSNSPEHLELLERERLVFSRVDGQRRLFFDNQLTSLSHLDGIVSITNRRDNTGYSFKGRRAAGFNASDGAPIYEISAAAGASANTVRGDSVQKYKLYDFSQTALSGIMPKELYEDENGSLNGGKIAEAFEKMRGEQGANFQYRPQDLKWAKTDVLGPDGEILYSTWQAYSLNSAEPVATVDGKGFIDFNVQYSKDVNGQDRRITAGLRFNLNEDLSTQTPKVVSVIVGTKALILNYSGNLAYIEERAPEGYLLSRVHLSITDNYFQNQPWQAFLDSMIERDNFDTKVNENNFIQTITELTAPNDRTIFELSNMEKFFYDDSSYTDAQGRVTLYTGAELAHKGIPSKTITYDFSRGREGANETLKNFSQVSEGERFSPLAQFTAFSKYKDNENKLVINLFEQYKVSESDLTRIDWQAGNIYFSNEREVRTDGDLKPIKMRLYDSVADFDGNRIAEMEYEYVKDESNKDKKVYTGGVFVGQYNEYGIAQASVSFLIRDGKLIPTRMSEYEDTVTAEINPYDNVKGNFTLYGYISRSIEGENFTVDFDDSDFLKASSAFFYPRAAAGIRGSSAAKTAGAITAKFANYIGNHTSSTTKIYNSGEGEIVMTLSGMPVDKNNRPDSSKSFFIQFNYYGRVNKKDDYSLVDRALIPKTPIASYTYKYDPQKGLNVGEYLQGREFRDSDALFVSNDAVPFHTGIGKGGVMYKTDVDVASGFAAVDKRLADAIEDKRGLQYIAYNGDGSQMFEVYDYVVVKAATGALGTVVSDKYYEIAYYDNASKANYSFLIEKSKFDGIRNENGEINPQAMDDIIKEIEANVEFLRNVSS
ncbi:MAG: hypothetical protein LBO62_03430, partial [Endomicrobium sp.]|nr:hypothetical protein [Endomicrobium sp.]